MPEKNRFSPLRAPLRQPWVKRVCHVYNSVKQFTVTVGTVFERSKVPLHKWVLATHLICSSKKGMSAHQLHRTLGVTYKTAWFMAHRIREAMGDESTGQLGGGSAPVEVDETYWGNKKRPGHFGRKGKGPHHQMKVVSLVERGGKARSFQFHTISGGVVRDVLAKNIAQSATVHTDESSIYKPLHRYVKEFDFRYNLRAKLGVSDAERTDQALKGISGKRLMYRDSSTRG